MENRWERIGLGVPTLLAGVTNIVILVVAAVQRNSVVLIVASLGAVIVGTLALAEEGQQRIARRLAAQMTLTVEQLVTLQDSNKSMAMLIAEDRRAIEGRVADLAHLVERRAGNARRISRDQFYERALELAKNPPPKGGVMRVFNMYGTRVRNSDARERYFEYLASPQCRQAGPEIKRIKVLSDETSFQWALEQLVASRQNPKASLSLLTIPDQVGLSPLLYPLNAHTYYGTQAFILCPGFSAQSAGADSSVIHLTDRGVVDALANYHEGVYRLGIELMAGGEYDVDFIERLATQFNMRSPRTLDLIRSLTI